MTKQIEAMRLALEALEKIGMRGWVERKEEAITALREALAERHKPCLERLPEPIRTPPEKHTKYWTIGLGKWTWGGTTHDYSCLKNGIWAHESDVWAVHAAIRKALDIEPCIEAKPFEQARGIK